jgi:hypothetical protein
VFSSGQRVSLRYTRASTNWDVQHTSTTSAEDPLVPDLISLCFETLAEEQHTIHLARHRHPPHLLCFGFSLSSTYSRFQNFAEKKKLKEESEGQLSNLPTT